MKIGIVLSSVPGYSETFFRNKIKGLQARGFEVLLFVDYYKSTDAGFPCQVIYGLDFSGHPLKTFFNGIWALLRALVLSPLQSIRLYRLDAKDGVPIKRRLKNMILNQFFLNQSLDWLHFGFGMLAKDRENVAEAIGAKMAVSFRGYDLYLSPLKHPDCYTVLFKKNVQYHVLSEGMMKTLQDYGIEKKYIHVINPAIDAEFFSNESIGNIHPTGILQIVTIARLHWKKGLEYTLEALARLNEKGVVFQYTIIGEGDQLERLIFAAHQLGISEAVCFLGKLSPQEVKKHLSEANIYLQYSIQEGFCNAVLEAQSMGLLTIVSNAEGLDENVMDGLTGWIVPKRNPNALAEKIIEVLQLPKEDREVLRKRAVSRVKSEFNLVNQNNEFYSFYVK